MYEIGTECRIVTDDVIYRIVEATPRNINITREDGTRVRIETYFYDLVEIEEPNMRISDVEHDDLTPIEE